MSTQIDIDTAWILKQLKVGEQAVADFKAEATTIQHTLDKLNKQVSPNFMTRYIEVKESLVQEIRADQFTKLKQSLVDSQAAVRAFIETDAKLGGKG
ncbi:hypothetical protein HB852_00710 [Listeria grandensis]|uniref:Uncharacterized protein n=1 Tax=Listeria grandensis TaxID=1494963 RepID=A0A7X0Y195_9LIST|nr:hypothetical protein [Listeria grandensis]MBC1473137.1 hypothetical protein [Listeria grandensis]MBC1935083.1 hypothetical protein [Listeria grandensis]